MTQTKHTPVNSGLFKPLVWNRQAEKQGRQLKVFCGSMCDVFDNSVDSSWLFKLFSLIQETPHLDWLLLTKRISNANKFLHEFNMHNFDLYKNLWLGITVCNQEEADRDIPKLLQTPAAIRFLSIEPMLGAVDLDRYLGCGDPLCECGDRGVDWVIVGGETGHNARRLNYEWVYSIYYQCGMATVPFFFKQWGEYNREGKKVGKKKAGSLLNGIDFKEYPQ